MQQLRRDFPDLPNNGYCVYAFNYGQTIPFTGFYAMGEIRTSAAELSAEVNSVLAETVASKVDLVGWSQARMMPRYYINDLGGAATVNMLVALAPSNYGTTVDGLTTLVADFGLLGVATGVQNQCPQDAKRSSVDRIRLERTARHDQRTRPGQPRLPAGLRGRWSRIRERLRRSLPDINPCAKQKAPSGLAEARFLRAPAERVSRLAKEQPLEASDD